jgi:hypothetical protein
MTTINPTRPTRRWTAEELRRLPPDQRDAILFAAAKAAESDYHSDPGLTGFEAFGDKDLHGDSSDSRAR